MESSANSSSVLIEHSDLDGFPVDIIKAGYSKSENSSKELILLIPGNPGIVQYYTKFVTELYKELGCSTPVWAISHSCHSHFCLDKSDLSCSPLDLEIEHKLRFLEQKIPHDWTITLVGHSIGCYMILSVLEILSGHKCRVNVNYLKDYSVSGGSRTEDDLKLFSRIKKCYFLFPTIERMRISPNGKRLWPVLSYLQWLVVGLITVVSWFPLFLRTKLVSLVLSVKRSDESFVAATVDLITPRMFRNMLQLAHDELTKVDVLDVYSIDTLKQKLVFYFGTTDRWCPLSYRNDLVKLIPDIENYVDCRNMKHAFVLSSSHDMASVLAKILRRNG